MADFFDMIRLIQAIEGLTRVIADGFEAIEGSLENIDASLVSINDQLAELSDRLPSLGETLTEVSVNTKGGDSEKS